MTLLEFNKIIDGKPLESVKPVEYVGITMEDLEFFRRMLSIDPAMIPALHETSRSKEFFDAFPILDSIEYSKEQKEDLFYAVKLGYFYSGVPCKLVYLITKAIAATETPNQALCLLKDSKHVAKYLVDGAINNGITIKQVVANVLGSEFKTITNSRRKVKFNNFYEIYVENVDSIVLVPEDIAGQINSIGDLRAVSFVPNVGVCVHDIPLRTFGNRYGITVNEFDLREVI